MLLRILRSYLIAATAIALLYSSPRSLSAQAAGAPSSSDDAWPAIALQRVSGDYVHPVHITHAGDGSGRLFVVEKSGLIRIVHNGQMLPDPFLDIRDRVNSACDECGLFSVAFPSDYESGGYFFVNYTAVEDLADPEPTDNGRDSGNDTVVARFRVTIDPNLAAPASEERILIRNQPYTNHNGGMLAFGPDGYLYIGMGDGGGGGDPLNSGQRTDTLLGKMLRLAVSSTGTYTIPPDNPFVFNPAYLPEIWALGLRNPWRFAFDGLLGDLYIADVGQNEWEEVNHQSAGSGGGENYGWNIMEGAHCYDATQCDQTGLTLPVHEYPQPDDAPCASVTGGTVYRGTNLGWHGVYFFADYCSGRISGLRRTVGVWESADLLDTNIRITSFGEDEAHELYLVGRQSNGQGASTGVVYQVTQAKLHFLPWLLNQQPN